MMTNIKKSTAVEDRLAVPAIHSRNKNITPLLIHLLRTETFTNIVHSVGGVLVKKNQGLQML